MLARSPGIMAGQLSDDIAYEQAAAVGDPNEIKGTLVAQGILAELDFVAEGFTDQRGTESRRPAAYMFSMLGWKRAFRIGVFRFGPGAWQLMMTS